MKNNVSFQRKPPIVLPQSFSAWAMLAYVSYSGSASGGFYLTGVSYPVTRSMLSRSSVWQKKEIIRLNSDIRYKHCKTTAYQASPPRLSGSSWSVWGFNNSITSFFEHSCHWWGYQHCILRMGFCFRLLFQIKWQQVHCCTCCKFEKEHAALAFQEMHLFPGLWSQYSAGAKRLSEVLCTILFLEQQVQLPIETRGLASKEKDIFRTLKQAFFLGPLKPVFSC